MGVSGLFYEVGTHTLCHTHTRIPRIKSPIKYITQCHTHTIAPSPRRRVRPHNSTDLFARWWLSRRKDSRSRPRRARRSRREVRVDDDSFFTARDDSRRRRRRRRRDGTTDDDARGGAIRDRDTRSIGRSGGARVDRARRARECVFERVGRRDGWEDYVDARRDGVGHRARRRRRRRRRRMSTIDDGPIGAMAWVLEDGVRGGGW